ncbi:MAG: serine protease family protein [Planctomycetota bacterium]|jgi:hypothetical protein
MKTTWTAAALATVLVAGALLCAPVRAEETESNFYADLLKAKAPALVSVKFVVKISIMGRSNEMGREATGVLVDTVGLVMVSNTELGGGMGFRMRGGGSVKPQASNFKVIFPGEEEEYDAILGATDSKLNLAFIRIRDLGEKKVTCVEFAQAEKLKIGQELVGVERFGKGFDYAPHFTRVLVSGEIEQPRTMYSVSGDRVAQGLPLFDKSGKVVGALASQSGAEGAGGGGRGLNIGGRRIRIPGLGGGGASGVFLIPAVDVKASVGAAKKQAEEALKKAAEEEEEEGEGEGEEEGEGEGEDEDEGW